MTWLKLTDEQMQTIEAHGHSAIVVGNRVYDPNYAPYCMRCEGLSRMREVSPFHWAHHGGAVCDARVAATAAGLLK